jgi:hypothetical protein
MFLLVCFFFCVTESAPRGMPTYREAALLGLFRGLSCAVSTPSALAKLVARRHCHPLDVVGTPSRPQNDERAPSA